MVTDAHHELERFDTDPAFRDRLSARVGEHVKALRQKITERGLVRRAASGSPTRWSPWCCWSTR